MNKTDILKIFALTKEYAKKTVLQVDELIIPKGKVIGIIGPSGAGKSTLLRIINLLEPPTQGRIHYFGAPVPVKKDEKLALQRRMMMVFQKPALLDMSVYDNVAFGLQAHGFPRKEAEKRVKFVLAKIGMEAQSWQRAKTLSGGEAQRVALARAIVMKPELLLLDEPTVNLDPGNVEVLEDMIRLLHHEYGTTILIVTHNLFQARRLCSEIIFMYQGRLIEKGEASRIFQEPSLDETRAFIEGKMIY